ncbi:hypothetical protein [Dolichospermum sp. LEGE 00240]|uniref:hypothetical protein n=1 Tax=Dolichospermum sp. LEGE 00240 TaxID=1828603 RepID=UPI0027151FCF|nr:hypothetical protein [Dolichospermum sp. LEGE 00240]
MGISLGYFLYDLLDPLFFCCFFVLQAFFQILLLDGHETAEYERQRAESEKEKSDRLIAQLRALGVEPEV